MNFLAHIFLSGKDEELIIGNFIADSVKGKAYRDYPLGIQRGIILHRAIDFYTDTHPTVRKSISRLFGTYRHYSGVIVDILYDHFLAANWKRYSNIPLDQFTSNFYKLLQQQHEVLPPNIQNFLPYMMKDNWLLSYSTVPGISKILWQMNERTNKKSNMNLAVNELEQYYPEFEEEFFSFFEELQLFAIEKTKVL